MLWLLVRALGFLPSRRHHLVFDMDESTRFSYNHHCRPAVSSSGAYVAYIHGRKLVIRSCLTFATKRLIDLDPAEALSIQKLTWDPLSSNEEHRLAVTSKDIVKIYLIDQDQADDNPIGTIIPGVAIQSVVWATCKNDTTMDVKLAIFSEDLLQCFIWSGDNIECEILSPKCARLTRSSSSSVALVSRPSTTDVINIISAGRGVQKIPLKGIITSQCVEVSSSGLYYAIVDTYATGYNVGIWGADGTHLRTYKGPYSPIYKIAGLGARVCAWLKLATAMKPPHLPDEVVLIGDCQDQISILNPLNNQPMGLLLHGTVHNGIPVWEEYLTVDFVMTYRAAALPFQPAKAKGERPNFVPGICDIKVSPNNAFLASRSSTMPNLAWIWSISEELELAAVVCQSSPIISLDWDPEGRFLLILPSSSMALGIWDSRYQEPILQEYVHLEGNILGATWCRSSESPGLLVSSDKYIGIEAIQSDAHRVGSPQLPADEDTKVVELANSVQQNEWVNDASAIENTFLMKRNIRQ